MSDELKRNELNIVGDNNFAFQNITNSQIEITQIIGKSAEYQNLVKQLETQKRLLSFIPETDSQERLEVSKEINGLQSWIEQFKRDVLTLAQTFDRIEINTKRLENAKKKFERGEFAEARAVLETEIEQMRDEQTRLLIKREEYESDVMPKLKSNAEEFLILALLTQSDYTKANWYADACRYFEQSLVSYITKQNISEYAYFLQNHNQLAAAEDYYQQYLREFAADISLADRAAILNNLGNLHKAKSEYETALKEYEEALEIYRNLAADYPLAYLANMAITLNNLGVLHKDKDEYDAALKEFEESLAIKRNLAADNPLAHLPDVAGTLNNLGNLHKDKNEYNAALKEFEEGLEIYRKLATDNPLAYLPNVAGMLNNLGTLHNKKNEREMALKKFEESFGIYRNLAADNPSAHLPDVAVTLNNLGNLHKKINEYDTALKEYEEALAIRRNLAADNPSVYLLDVAGTLINLAIFYLQGKLNREQSVEYAMEALIILFPIVEKVPITAKYYADALRVLNAWGLSDEEIEQLLDERAKESE